ncbi:hypothetical protein Nlim_0544 [Candidatus Nitrosarchaeum limnium SFB1]|jgi:hypothetical protein|uniref:RiboL-PSP-HEPN domain-containing protein n=1 Tax=Candidatus Nitrosarchaeum limnium SFB1 TaxID=886738 RepID=F3KJ86_9ARCH|nr:hypothetical protein Nlim_0544 [Candidatus Nitrosarchaeum limnium SFB1]
MIVSDFLQEIKKQKKISNQVRLYVINKNKHYFLNDGVLKNGFNSKLTIMKNRDSVLSAFSKMAFLFDEIICLRIVSYSNQKDNKELLYLLNLVPINRKIRAFLDWGVFSPEYTRNMSRLFEVRNDTVHCVSLDEVRYNPKTPISLSSVDGFKKFKTDMCKAWDDLLKIYLNQQANIDWIALSKEVKIKP